MGELDGTRPCLACSPDGSPAYRRKLDVGSERRSSSAGIESVDSWEPVTSLGSVSVAMTSHGAGTYSCPGNQFGHNHAVLRLLIVVRGRLRLRVGQRHVSVGPGHGVFIAGDMSYSYVAHEDVSTVLMDISADDVALAAVLPEPCVPLSTPSLLATTAAFVTRTFTPDERSREAASAASRRAQVLSHIAAHHGRPELNVETLAADLGLSTRSLQRLFACQEKGVAEEITAARLHHALTLLRDPLLLHVTLEEIAARSGFGAVGRLRRAIRTATGLNPREYRARYHGELARERRLQRSRTVQDGFGLSLAV